MVYVGLVAMFGMMVGHGAPSCDQHVACIMAGDYEEMAFSPSGRYLVLADRVVVGDTVVNQLVLYDFDRQQLDTILPAARALRYVNYVAIAYRFKWQGDSALVAVYFDGDEVESQVTIRIPDGQVLHEEHDYAGIDGPPEDVLEAVIRLYPEERKDDPESIGIFGYALLGRTIVGPDFIVFPYRGSSNAYGVWLYGLTRRRTELLQLLPTGAADYGFVGGFADGNNVVLLTGGDTLTLWRWREGALVPLLKVTGFWQHAGLQTRGSEGKRTWFLLRPRRAAPDQRHLVLAYEDGLVSDVAPDLTTADMQMHFGRRLMALSYWQGDRRRVVVRQF